MNAYSILGDGTSQALIPIFTEQTEVELPTTEKQFEEAQHVDIVYPFIWKVKVLQSLLLSCLKESERAGYITQYGEDVGVPDTFTYRLKGFMHKPTDHYTRPLARVKSLLKLHRNLSA